MEWSSNLRVNTTCAMRVQIANAKRGYHAVLSQLFRESMKIVLPSRVNRDSYNWNTTDIVFPLSTIIHEISVRTRLTFVLGCGLKDAGSMGDGQYPHEVQVEGLSTDLRTAKIDTSSENTYSITWN